MPARAERAEQARDHVERGRLIIRRQKQLIEKLAAEGRDTTAADELLTVFQFTQKVLERDFIDLEKRANST